MNQFPYFIAHGNNVTLHYRAIEISVSIVNFHKHAGSILELNI